MNILVSISKSTLYSLINEKEWENFKEHRKGNIHKFFILVFAQISSISHVKNKLLTNYVEEFGFSNMSEREKSQKYSFRTNKFLLVKYGLY